MIHLHVTKEVFEQIKTGKKEKEFRPDNERYRKIFKDILYFNDHVEPAKIYLGYPKKNDYSKILDVGIKCCYWVPKYHSMIDPLFFKYYPNYNLDWVIVAEFKLSENPFYIEHPIYKCWGD